VNAQQIAEALGGTLRSGRAMVKCPAHEDRSPSLSIRESGNRTLLHCFGGCQQSEVIEALQSRGLWGGISLRNIPVPPPKARDPRERDQLLSDAEAFGEGKLDPTCIWGMLREASDLPRDSLDRVASSLSKHPDNQASVRQWFDAWLAQGEAAA
jgi:hypothetical protein